MHILNELESDTTLDAATLFSTLTASYLAETRERTGPVSTPRSPDELAARFDEAMPQLGRPLAEVVQRLRDEVLPDCNRLYHPRYAGYFRE